MKKALIVIASLALLTTACGDSGSASPCDALVDDAVDLFQDVLDELGNLSFEDMAELGDEPPPALADLETRGAELEQRAEDLDCSEAELEARFQERVDDLTADGPFAELILEGIRSESFFSE